MSQAENSSSNRKRTDSGDYFGSRSFINDPYNYDFLVTMTSDLDNEDREYSSSHYTDDYADKKDSYENKGERIVFHPERGVLRPVYPKTKRVYTDTVADYGEKFSHNYSEQLPSDVSSSEKKTTSASEKGVMSSHSSPYSSDHHQQQDNSQQRSTISHRVSPKNHPKNSLKNSLYSVQQPTKTSMAKRKAHSTTSSNHSMPAAKHADVHKHSDKQAKSIPVQPVGTRTQRNQLKFLSITSGLIAFILFCLIPLLPVKQVESSISWPQGQDLNSVNAPLMSYSPQAIDMAIPLSLANNVSAEETTLLSTLPPKSDKQTLRGLFVRSTDNGVDVVIRNVVPLTVGKETIDSLPTTAVLHVHSDHKETRAWITDSKDSTDVSSSEVGAKLEGVLDGDMRPMITGIFTEIVHDDSQTDQELTQAAIAEGLDVTVDVDSRFTSSPTALKILAMIFGSVIALISLYSLHRLDRLDPNTRYEGIHPKGWAKPRLLDGVVGSIILYWYLIGANTSDDGYILTMARASNESGYMSNYYRWFGVAEAPFGFPYYDILAQMVKISTASLWIRLPELLATFFTWLILSREVLPRLGSSIGERRLAQWTSAMVFLVFWMSFNNGTRPEPIIALGSILTWVFIERALATNRLFLAAIAVIIASLSVAAGPTGLMAAATLLGALTSLVKILIARLPYLDAPKGASRSAIIFSCLALLMPFLAVGTWILVGIFYDQTLQAVLEAVRVRTPIGPALEWYEEPYRYQQLFAQTIDGSFSRRFPVLMMFLSSVVVLGAVLRYRNIPGTNQGPTLRLMFTFAGALFFMIFTPTKWTHHFGVFAGIVPGIAAVAAVAVSYMALRSRRNRILFLSAVLMIFAFALSGVNGWWYIGSYGVPWYDKTPQINSVEFSTVTLFTSFFVLAWGVWVGFTDEVQHARATTKQEIKDIDRREQKRSQKFVGVAAAPIAVLCTIVVLFNMASLTKGFIAQWPAYSLAKDSIDSLSGDTCALASNVLVEKNTNDSFLPTADGSPLAESLVNSSSSGFKPNNIPSGLITNNPETGAQLSGKNSEEVQEDEGGKSGGSMADLTVSDSGTNEADSIKDGANSASESDSSEKVGINGSRITLPFGLDPKKVPVVGSYTDGVQFKASTTTKWYSLPEERSDNKPLLVFTVAGRIEHINKDDIQIYGQRFRVDYGRQQADGTVNIMSGDEGIRPRDIGPFPKWRNLRVDMDDIPEDADVVRVRAIDDNVTPDQWLAFTPPRVPEMETLNERIGSETPTLLDWPVPLQFPCQRPFSHYAGVAEVPKYRISSEFAARAIHSAVQDYYGGGAGGLVGMTTYEVELPTYAKNDWSHDWGIFFELRPYKQANGKLPKDVTVDYDEKIRSGLYYPGPIKYSQS